MQIYYEFGLGREERYEYLRGSLEWFDIFWAGHSSHVIKFDNPSYIRLFFVLCDRDCPWGMEKKTLERLFETPRTHSRVTTLFEESDSYYDSS